MAHMQVFSGQTVIPCGMDRGVAPIAPAAPSTHHHGSMYNCLLPQLMVLRSGSVVIKRLEMKILQYNSLNSTSNELDITNTTNKLELEFVARLFYCNIAVSSLIFIVDSTLLGPLTRAARAEPTAY